MKKRTLSLLLALVMCLLLVPMTALAANDTPVISNLAVVYDNEAGQCFLTFKLENADATYDGIQGQYAADGGEWIDLDISDINDGICGTYRSDDLAADKYIQYRIHFLYFPDSYGPWSNVLKLNEPVEIISSPWAKPYAEKAGEYDLFPDCLAGADLTQPITRAEFAALAVKLYEAMSSKTATAIEVNPFTDTTDTEVLKAYNVGIIDGIGGGKFAPTQLVTREQAATMLTRTYKATYWDGWTLKTDSTYTANTLDNTGVFPFADDAKISGWAKPSVYFMVKNKIIDGVGNNLFAPNTANIPAGAAVNYGQATREAALKIAVVSYENLAQSST